MSSTEIHSKEEFDKAIQTEGKYVFILAYEHEASAKADEMAQKFSATTAAYKVDVGKEPKIKEYFKITTIPTAIIYKDGKEVKMVEGMDPAGMAEVSKMLS